MDGEAYEIMIIFNNSVSTDSKNGVGYKIKSKAKNRKKKQKILKMLTTILRGRLEACDS